MRLRRFTLSFALVIALLAGFAAVAAPAAAASNPSISGTGLIIGGPVGHFTVFSGSTESRLYFAGDWGNLSPTVMAAPIRINYGGGHMGVQIEGDGYLRQGFFRRAQVVHFVFFVTYDGTWGELVAWQVGGPTLVNTEGSVRSFLKSVNVDDGF